MYRLKHLNWVRVLYFTLQLIAVIVLMVSVYKKNSEDIAMAVLTLFFLWLPFLFEKKLKLKIPSIIEISLLLFIFGSYILGVTFSFYSKIPVWDNILHFTSGVLSAAIGLSILRLVNKFKNNISVVPVILFAFAMSLATSVLWEFWEFGTDQIFKTDTQRDTIITTIYSQDLPEPLLIDEVLINGKQMSGYIDIGLIDTMTDLFYGTMGALVSCSFLFIYLRSNTQSRLNKVMIYKIKT